MFFLREADFPPFLAGKQGRPSRGWGVCKDGGTPAPQRHGPRGRTTAPRGIMCILNEPWPILQIFFQIGGTVSKEHKGADPLHTFGMLSMGLQSAITEAELRICSYQDAISCIQFFFSTSTRKCYLTVSIYLSH